jgi:hypothetical protein
VQVTPGGRPGRKLVVVVTQQYLKGELSLRLGEACEAPPDHSVERALIELRRRVEDAPLTALPALAVEAENVLDAACWAWLEHGDMTAFCRTCSTCARLHEFACCAGLLP